MTSTQYSTVRIQHWFVLALVLKVACSLASWWLKSPWVLGLAVPLIIMAAYIALGYFKRERDVSDEKFADSCYYLGFIFTITSIIVSLFDLPALGAKGGLSEVAVRFGAAMISTVFGMGVRVAMVSFKKDVDDAVRDAEEAVIDAVRMLTAQLESVVGGLKVFEEKVIDATNTTVANVDKQIDKLSQDYAQKIIDFHKQVTDENRAAFREMVGEVRGATSRLADSVQTYSSAMQSHLQSIETKVTEFAGAVTDRLRTTVFPDDFFVKQLQAPLDKLRIETAELGASVQCVAAEVLESSETMHAAFAAINGKTKTAQDAMDSVVQLSMQHRTILEHADLQLNVLKGLAQSLNGVDIALHTAFSAFETSAKASTELLGEVAALNRNTSTLRVNLSEQHRTIADHANQQLNVIAGLAQRLDRQDSVLNAELTALDANTKVTADLLAQVALLSQHASDMRSSMRHSITTIKDSLDSSSAQASGLLQMLVTQFAEMRTAANGVMASLERGAGAVDQVGQHLTGSLDALKTISNATVDAASGATQASIRASQTVEAATTRALELLERTYDTALVASAQKTFLLGQEGTLVDAIRKLEASGDSRTSAIADAALQSFSSAGAARVDSIVVPASSQATGPKIHGAEILTSLAASAPEPLAHSSSPETMHRHAMNSVGPLSRE